MSYSPSKNIVTGTPFFLSQLFSEDPHIGIFSSTYRKGIAETSPFYFDADSFQIRQDEADSQH